TRMPYVFRHPAADDALGALMPYVFRHSAADDALGALMRYVFRHPAADDAVRTPTPYTVGLDARRLGGSPGRVGGWGPIERRAGASYPRHSPTPSR
ncbi:MAG: hypothetical protein M3Q82_07405, partial [Actinomycetota bacterium]|nr:hypothetical protein [Actinomycetota bacterium]